MMIITQLFPQNTPGLSLIFFVWQITNLEGSRGQPVTRKSTLKKSVYLLPGYYDKEFEREKEQKKTST